MTAYLSLDRINYDMTFAPLGFEDEFEERIINDIQNTIKNLDTKKTINRNIKNKYLAYLVNYTLELFTNNEHNSRYDVYIKHTYYLAGWNIPPSKTNYGKNHREILKSCYLTVSYYPWINDALDSLSHKFSKLD